MSDWEPRQTALGTFYRRRLTYFHSDWFRRIVRNVTTHALRIARQGVITLTYGDAVQSIWEAYRSDVDAALAQLGLEEHLWAIRDSVLSNNPEAWQQAMFECREVLVGLAARLWTDPTGVYREIRSRNGEPMAVDGNHNANRLVAYLHCKGVSRSTQCYVQDELERIVGTVHALIDHDN